MLKSDKGFCDLSVFSEICVSHGPSAIVNFYTTLFVLPLWKVLFLFNGGMGFRAKRDVYFRNACITYLFVRYLPLFVFNPLNTLFIDIISHSILLTAVTVFILLNVGRRPSRNPLTAIIYFFLSNGFLILYGKCL